MTEAVNTFVIEDAFSVAHLKFRARNTVSHALDEMGIARASRDLEFVEAR